MYRASLSSMLLFVHAYRTRSRNLRYTINAPYNINGPALELANSLLRLQNVRFHLSAPPPFFFLNIIVSNRCFLFKFHGFLKDEKRVHVPGGGTPI